ncbi:hypothetical protein BYT27DRAFT_7193018, partial [Phlegmacium glaucopus]
HQQNPSRLACLVPDMPDATRLPYLVWQHNNAPDAIMVSCPTTGFQCRKFFWQHK